VTLVCNRILPRGCYVMMDTDKIRCLPACEPHRTVFCPRCGKADRTALRRVRLMGPVGVLNSNSPAIEAFWATGDPSVFS